MLRPELQAIAGALIEREGEISLDQIAEAIGTLRVTPDEIDALFSWLEARGREVGAPSGRAASALLHDVLRVARSLRLELGRAPHPREIAERSALPLDAVQRALWFARILQR
ncbi:MAG TPA: sigma-70 domain-containing protein [Polyangiaceae bacterium]|nr:sigma-70 domain-containing protein [Polyangiaceae bacterium]